MSDITLSYSGNFVGTASSVRLESIQDVEGLPKGTISLFYFANVTLSPPLVFDHMSGLALTRIFDGTDLIIGDRTLKGLKYIHGRSDVAKGKPSVTAVLLASMPPETNKEQAMLAMPRLYTAFLSLPKKG